MENTIYEAAFKLNDKKIEAEFDSNGSFIAEEKSNKMTE